MRFRVFNSDRDIYRADNRHIVGGFLSNFLAVVVSVTAITSMSVSSGSWLADSNHLDVSYLFKGDLNSFGSSVFSFLGIRV